MSGNSRDVRPPLRPGPENDLEATVDRFEADPNATSAFVEEGGPSSERPPSTTDSVLSVGSRFGDNFRLEQQLGRGGMGEAWKAYDETADRSVVLKFVPKEIQHIQAAMDSVRFSFKKAHSLQHQHICPLYGLFTDPDHGLYVIMKYVEGVSLDEYRRRSLHRQGRMAFTDAVNILWATARALDYAHEKKIIHRDIKPQNIMVSKIDGVQVIDFGLAEEIRMSMVQYSEAAMDVAGTRPYMAPEQWRGRMQDARTDQYALAATAYELFCGLPPFQGSDLGILRECVLYDDPEPIEGAPHPVNAALLRGLAKKRDERFPDCKSLIRAMVEQSSGSREFGFPDDHEHLLAEGSSILHLPDPVIGDTNSPIWLPKSVFATDSHASTKPPGSADPTRHAVPSFPYPNAPYRHPGHPPTPAQHAAPVIVTDGRPEKKQDPGSRVIRITLQERTVLYALIVVLIALLVFMAFYLFHVTAPSTPEPTPKPRPRPRAASVNCANINNFV